MIQKRASVWRLRAPYISLPWYDLEEVRPATDALWHALSRRLRREGISDIPQPLNRDTPYQQQWSSPRLLLSQACGYDILGASSKWLQPVATPVYSAPGCGQGTYSSFVVVREESSFNTLEDLRGARCIINTPNSHSGMNILRALVAPLHVKGRFFSAVQVSGGHTKSLSMILARKAEVAAIDCVTYALLVRYRPGLISGTRILCRTHQFPAPPYVTSGTTSKEMLRRLRTALFETFEDPIVAAVKEDLFLKRVEFLPLSAYLPIVDLEKWAVRHGYSDFNGAWRRPCRCRNLSHEYADTSSARGLASKDGLLKTA